MKRVYICGSAEKYVNYRLAVEAAGGQAAFTDWASADALLLPGGGDLEPWRYGQENTASRNLEPERDAEELALLERFVAAGKPVLGICRGFQTINVFFGGTLCQDIPGHSALHGKDRRHPVRAVPLEPLPETSPARLAQTILRAYPFVNSAHHQAAERLGNGLCLLQIAPDGVPEAFAHERLPVWGVQWHPERMRAHSFFRAFLELVPAEEKPPKAGAESDTSLLRR